MRLNKKGFTLVELLAVIVILGILLIVAIPATTRIIDNSRSDSFISSGKMYISAMQNLVAAEMDPNQNYCATVDNLGEGATKSPWGSGNIEGYVTYNKDDGYKAYITAGSHKAMVTKDSDRKVVDSDSLKNVTISNDCTGHGTPLS